MSFRIPIGAAAGMMLFLASAAWAQDIQVGARCKGMGGNSAALIDDPTSIWSNPAGIATQVTKMGISYQTFVQYEPDFTAGPSFLGDPEASFIDPQLLPSFQGFVFQIGTPESPMAVGIAYVQPLHVKYTWDSTAAGTLGIVDQVDEQAFSRIRIAFAKDWRIDDGRKATKASISVGLGIDMGFTKWNEVFNLDSASTTQDFTNEDTASAIGMGFGILFIVDDPNAHVLFTFGLGFNSGIQFHLQRQAEFFPIWKWPSSFDISMAVAVGKEREFLVKMDFQIVGWDKAINENTIFSFDDSNFQSTFNFTLGGEYRTPIAKNLWLTPRLGMKIFDPPWNDESDLPGSGLRNLLIDTKGSSMFILALGAGLSWKSPEGKNRTVDWGLESGGDAMTFAVEYNHDF